MNITDTLSAVSILTATLTFFFDITSKSIDKALKIEIAPKEQKIAREKQKKEVSAVFWKQAIPIFVGSLALWYTCLPQTYEIFCTSKLYLLHFEIARTLFIFLEIGLSILVVLTFTGLCHLWKKLRYF